MKSKLFILGTAVLVGLSAVVHGAGKKYVDGHAMDGSIPTADCLEMKCQYGCIEEEGTFKGHCCPSGGSYGQACNPDGVSLNECCQGDKGLLCAGANGTCSCPSATPYWNGSQCVECLEDESPCKKCGSDYRWYYPAYGSWVNNNPCQQCNGSGGSFNVAYGSWINNNPCQVCNGSGGSFNVASGSWVNNNPCQQCNGSGGSFNVAYGSWINNNPCQVCNGSGGSLNVAYGSWVNNNPCQQCNGSGGSFNVSYNTPINGNVCQVCNGYGSSTTLSSGENKQTNGKCCVGGGLAYSDSYCPGCKNMTLGNRYSMACYWYDDECVAHFGWSDTRTISVVEKNMTLKADVLHIVNFTKYVVKDETTGSYLVNKTSLSWNSSLDSTVTLQAGHTYTIDLKFENLCDHCSVTATCN